MERKKDTKGKRSMTRGMINLGVTNFGGDLFWPRPLGHDPRQIEKENEERRIEQKIVTKKMSNSGNHCGVLRVVP